MYLLSLPTQVQSAQTNSSTTCQIISLLPKVHRQDSCFPHSLQYPPPHSLKSLFSLCFLATETKG